MFRDELAYAFHSRALYVLLALMLLLAGFGAYSTFTRARSAILDYAQTRDEMAAQGVDVDEALTADLNVSQTQENGTTLVQVDNPVRYSYEEVVRSTAALAPADLASGSLATIAFLAGPLLFGLWGVFLATHDFVNKTVKVKAVYKDWRAVAVTKLSVGALGVIVTVVLVAAVATLAAGPLHQYAASIASEAVGGLPQAEVPAPAWGDLALQAGVAVMMGLLSLSIGFALGMVSRSPYVPIASVLVYNVFVPVLGRYDPKNLGLALGHAVFTSGGVLQLAPARPVPIGAASGLIAGLCIAAAAVAVASAHFQSKYVS